MQRLLLPILLIARKAVGTMAAMKVSDRRTQVLLMYVFLCGFCCCWSLCFFCLFRVSCAAGLLCVSSLVWLVSGVSGLCSFCCCWSLCLSVSVLLVSVYPAVLVVASLCVLVLLVSVLSCLFLVFVWLVFGSWCLGVCLVLPQGEGRGNAGDSSQVNLQS